VQRHLQKDKSICRREDHLQKDKITYRRARPPAYLQGYLQEARVASREGKVTCRKEESPYIDRVT
jgi:hypothetical protein